MCANQITRRLFAHGRLNHEKHAIDAATARRRGGAVLSASTLASSPLPHAILSFVTFYFAVTLLAMCPIEANLRFVAAAWYLAFCAIVAYTRYRVRRHRQILHGDVLTDMCIAVLFYPLALVQHEKELRAPDDFYIPEKESEEKEA